MSDDDKPNPVGRPLKFKSAEEMQEQIDAYFDSIKEPRAVGDGVYFEPATVTGLALALDTTRELLCNYTERDEFSDTIKRAKLRCENYAERQLYIGKAATGPIFALKNFGWSDSQDLNLGNKDGQAFKTDNKVEIVHVKPD